MEIPKCPECGKPLEVVIPHSCGVAYRWSEEEGKYEVDDAQQQETYVCGNCRKPIGGWRADGERWGFIPETE